MQRTSLIRRLVFTLLVSAFVAFHARAANELRDYTHEDFVTSYWCGPTAGHTTFERYQEIKNANFTVAFPIYGSATVEQNRAMLDFCQRLGMKAIIYDNRMPRDMTGDHKRDVDAVVKDFRDHPGLLGHSIIDEPVAGAFDGLGQVTAYLREHDPKHPGYINLMPTWAREIPAPPGGQFSWLGTPTYEDYVRSFVQKTKPAWLCYDHYAMLKQGDRPDFFENLETVRRVALEASIPFWNIVLLTQHGDYRVLTESELRFEAMQTMAFGARGLVWFTYWNPGELDKSTTWTHAMIEPDGTRNPHYDMVTAINADVLAMGRELKHARSISVSQHGGDDKGARYKAGESPVVVEAGTVTVGAFHDADAGKHFAMLASLDYKAAHSVKLRIPAASAGSVERLDPASRTWSQIKGKDGVELNLPAGGGVLLRWSVR
jgi:hypothetical protein